MKDAGVIGLSCFWAKEGFHMAHKRTYEELEQRLRELEREALERKRVEEALRETNELLEKIFSTTHLSIAYMDTDFNFIRVNHAYAAEDGREPEFFVNKNHFDLYPNTSNQAIFAQVVEKGEPYTVYAKPFEYSEHPERGVTYWDWSLYPVKNSSEEVEGLVLGLVCMRSGSPTPRILISPHSIRLTRTTICCGSFCLDTQLHIPYIRPTKKGLLIKSNQTKKQIKSKNGCQLAL